MVSRKRPLVVVPSAVSQGVDFMETRWLKVKAVGKGSFGTVWLVKSRSSDGQAEYQILKEVSLRGLPPSERKATMNEVSVLQRLHHPYISTTSGTEPAPPVCYNAGDVGSSRTHAHTHTHARLCTQACTHVHPRYRSRLPRVVCREGQSTHRHGVGGGR